MRVIFGDAIISGDQMTDERSFLIIWFQHFPVLHQLPINSLIC